MGLFNSRYSQTEEPLGPGSSGISPNNRRGLKLAPLILFAVFALFYYFSNREEVPLTGRKQVVALDRESEMSLGLQTYRQVLMEAPVISSGPDLELVSSVGTRIAKVTANEDFKWEFAVIDSAEVNAFCLPGGKVVVYKGMFPVAKGADGLAVVMGHEIAHAIARHGAERMAHQQLTQFGQLALGAAVGEMQPEAQRAVMGAFGLGTQFGVLLPFSRKHESEADYMGIIFMARACFDPKDAPHFWRRMAEAQTGGRPPEFLSTHPSDETRITQLEEWLPKAVAEYKANCPQ